MIISKLFQSYFWILDLNIFALLHSSSDMFFGVVYPLKNPERYADMFVQGIWQALYLDGICTWVLHGESYLLYL